MGPFADLKKIGLPSTGCSFLFSSDANTILSNELVGLNTTQYPAKILEKGYITTISGGTHIYESPSILKDYKVFRAKETSVSHWYFNLFVYRCIYYKITY